MKKILTISEYAKLRGVTTQAIINMINRKKEMPGVLKIEKICRMYLLHVNREKIEKSKRKTNGIVNEL